MAVIRPSESISKIAGSLGDHVYSSWKGQAVLRSKAINRSNSSSSRQSTARSGLTALSKEWFEKLTKKERTLWEEFAKRTKITPDPASSREQGSRVVITQPKSVLSGYNSFIRTNQRAVETGIRTLGNPITIPLLEFPNPVTNLERVVTPPIPRNFALNFNGVDEDVTCGNVLNYEYNVPQAWDFWVNADSLLNARRFLGKLQLTPKKSYDVQWSGGDIIWGIFCVGAGEWIAIKRAFTTTGSYVHIVATYDGSNNANGMELYVNSVPGHIVRSNTPILQTIITSAPLTFASSNGQVGSFLDGRMECIRNYNRHLLQADVNVLFESGAGRFGSNPLGDGSCQGAWMFCSGGGNTLFDDSGNNYHGTLRNMEPVDWYPGHVPCPDIPAVDQIQWTMPTVPAGSKVRIWLMSYDAGVHKQHVATVDSGVGFWIPDTVRVAGGREVPIASMPGHYLVQADVISPGGNQSPPSNTIEMTIP